MTVSAGRRPESTSVFVLVAGPPGSGKSTLALPLASELRLPLLAKDAIKEALIEVLGAPATLEDSRELGRASVMALLTVASTSPGAVL
ncbi:MAG: AAA family ATPase, partial [Solirubrobacterales bacterium]|nr:AAA family ATPase [Solirubrobacterales bacterium]